MLSWPVACACLALLAGCAQPGLDATSLAIAEDARREIAAHPSAYINGEARAFLISRAGQPRGLLWGTMHTGYDDVTIPPAAIRQRLEQSKDVTVEVPIHALSPSQVSALMAPCRRAARQPDPSAYAELDPATRSAIKSLDLPRKPQDLSLLGLYYAVILLPGPVPQTALPSGGSPDLILARTARNLGLEVHTLERADSQVALLCSKPNGPVAALDLRLAIRRRPDQVQLKQFARNAYQTGQVAAVIAALFTWRTNEADAAALAEERHSLLGSRNPDMARQLSARLAEPGQHFIAVGAGHLIGDDGLVELLAKDGWTMTPCIMDRCP